MANKLHSALLLILLTIFLSTNFSEQLQSSYTHTLLRIKRLLNYPSVLSNWNSNTDFCSTDSKASLTVICYEDTITQLIIVGETSPQQLLPKNFSLDSFVTTLVRLPNLKVLTLVSLGLWGPIPGKISYLSSLEILNMTSNFLYGTIPHELSLVSNLQALVLDHNMFSGHMSGWMDMDSFTSLTVLSLKHNLFNGSLPESLSRLKNIRVVSLSHNHFYGELPDLSQLTNLQVLELDGNSFGPNFPRLGNKLVTLVLSNNKFRSSVGNEVVRFYQLERLDISGNMFVGPFQLAILSLPAISYINVSRNRLTGMLVANLSCNSGLEVVDLSSNLLTGELPKCLVSDSNDRRTFLYDGNCLEETNQNQNQNQNQHELQFCHTEALAVGIVPERKEKHKGVSKAVLSIGIVGGSFGGLGLVALIFFIVGKSKDRRSIIKKPSTKLISENAAPGYTPKLISDARHISQTMKFGTVGLPPYRAFSLEEIMAATNNFDTACYMGEGSQGKMSRGQLKDGSLVAIISVKMIKNYNTQKDLMNHIELISKFRHPHLVSVLGHCFDCYEDDLSVSSMFLVFEYVPNGTLKSWISDGYYRKSLTWTQRIAAAIGIARGIEFLHTGIVPGVFSNNLKISNVLLDQNFAAKISTYNMPVLSYMGKVGLGNSSSGFKSPSFRKSVKCEDKSDIYDFGVIMMELILGRTVNSSNVDTLKDLLQASITADDEARKSIIDPAVRIACLDQSLKTMMEICVRCLVKEPEDRPSIEDVLWNLQFAAQVQDAWRGDQFSK